MLEGFFFIIIIVNCLFLYRSKVRVKRIQHLLHIYELYISLSAEARSAPGHRAVGNLDSAWPPLRPKLKNKECYFRVEEPIYISMF